MTTYEKLFIHASGMYLTEQVPEEYNEWDEIKLIGFVGDHVTEMYDHLDPSDVLSEIEQAADHWWQFILGNV